MKKQTIQTLSVVSSAAVLLAGCAVPAPETNVDAPAQAVSAAAPVQKDSVLELNAAEAKKFDSIANVQGSFSYNQDTVTPADEIFNLFGTVVTGMCAKPGFELENSKADYYVNVGGRIRQSYTVDLKKSEGQTSRTLLCSCSTGPATANANIVGVKLESVLSLAEMDEDVNTVKVTGSDGYSMAMPLSYALEKQAMVVYKINDQDVPSGTQLWVPGTVAKYFIRDVVDIELTAEESVPEIEQRSEALRAEVAIVNKAENAFAVGDEIAFEGYADDCGDAIAAVEFSLDGGETWTSCPVEASAERWVYWHFGYKAETVGSYQLSVRARTVSGKVSPLAATVEFAVE